MELKERIEEIGGRLEDYIKTATDDQKGTKSKEVFEEVVNFYDFLARESFSLNLTEDYSIHRVYACSFSCTILYYNEMSDDQRKEIFEKQNLSNNLLRTLGTVECGKYIGKT